MKKITLVFFTCMLIFMFTSVPSANSLGKPHGKPNAFFPDCVANGFMQIPACDDNGQHHLPPPKSFCGNNQTEVFHIPLYDEFNATLAYADVFYTDNSVGCGSLWIGILKESGICMTIQHINTIELTNPPSDGSRTVAQSSLPYNDCTDQSWFSTYILGIASDAGDLQCAYAGIVYTDEYNFSHTRNSNSYCATF